MQDINYAYVNSDTRKPSNAVSWIGFSFSLFVLLLLWLTLIAAVLIMKHNGSADSSGVASVLMLFFMTGTPLGIAGLILSVVGLIKASNNGGKKWIGACGLVFSALSVLSIFLLIIIGLS